LPGTAQHLMLCFLSMGSYLGEPFIACKSAISFRCRTGIYLKCSL